MPLGNNYVQQNSKYVDISRDWGLHYQYKSHLLNQFNLFNRFQLPANVTMVSIV